VATRARRSPSPRTAPHLRVIPGGARRRATLPFAVVLVLAVFAVAALQAYLGQEGYRMSRIESELKVAEERYVLLRAQLAELSSPSSLERAAAEMGMTSDADPVFLPAPTDLPDPEVRAAPYDSKRLLTTGG